MATHAQYKIPAFWTADTKSYKNLDYNYEVFNDQVSIDFWRKQGYTGQFTGEMCDMRSEQPKWNNRIIATFQSRKWQDIGTSYYRMSTGTVLPTHSDLYVKYVKLHNLQGQEHRIRRAIVFLEDWKPGHYSEIDGKAFVDWKAGDVLEWNYDLPHAAANIGLEDRYTLQITGWV
jgi:hypothetical protein